MSTEARITIEDNFERHAEKIKVLIARVEAKKDFKTSADISSRLETSLRVHENILEQLAEKKDDEVKAIIALGDVAPGTYLSEIKVELPAGVRLVRVVPDRVQVQVLE